MGAMPREGTSERVGLAGRAAQPLPARLLVVTDRSQTARPLDEVVRDAMAGGARWVSLREKDLGAAERLALLRRLREAANACGAALTVHGDVEAAAALGLAGVHLQAGADPAAARRRLGKRALIGVSTHSAAEAREAAERGADYVTLGPIHFTPSKPGYGPALGLDGLAAACRAAACPVVALGGIVEASAAACLDAGAAAVAVMGEVMRAADTRASVARLLAALGSA
jgi:thiamine-phosphate pyrophosphorylase